MKRILFPLITAFVVLVACLAIGEVLVRVFSPVDYLHPRYEYSAEYGLKPFPNVTMVHGVPGRYRFVYTTNGDGGRGADFPAAPNSGRRNVVVLGDSYTFGMGVRDGEEYPAVLGRVLGEGWSVVNLGSPGWGLTQQVRRYIEFGARYDPEAVVLQFCSNDPEDNLTNRVTRVVDGEIVFRDSAYGMNWIKKYLSRSIIQRSQLYNFVRGRASLLAQRRFLQEREREEPRASGAPGGESLKDTVYRELLTAFAERLRAERTPLVMIAVDGQLDRYPHIREAVFSLDERGLLTYLEVREWLGELDGDYRSPEGHVWGPRAHEAIGRGLAAWIRGDASMGGGR